MDAVKRYWQVLRALVLNRPLIAILLGLFYVAAGLLGVKLDANKMGLTLAILSAIPACGFVALATERTIQYASAGASLGIPRHSESLRHGQLLVLAIVVLLPALFGLYKGAPPALMLLLVVPAAMGVLVVVYAKYLFAVWIVVTLTSHWAPRDTGFILLAHPGVRAALIVVSVAVLWHWLTLANRSVTRSGANVSPRADARHEATAASLANSLGANEAQLDAYDAVLARDMLTVTAGVSNVTLSEEAFRAVLAIGKTTNWRAAAWMVGIGWLALFFVHSTRRSMDYFAFIGLSLLIAMNLLNRVAALSNAWRARGAEEALLVLMPRWPPEQKVKTLWIQVIGRSQLGNWVSWIVIVVPFCLIGWVTSQELAWGFVTLCAATLGASGAFLFALSSEYVRDWSIATVMILLCTATGAVLVVMGSHIAPFGRATGGVFMLGPIACSLIRFQIRPLQFPVRRIGKR